MHPRRVNTILPLRSALHLAACGPFIAVCGPSAYAQMPIVSAVTPPSAFGSRQVGGVQDDVIFGRGVRGPYLLTFRGLPQNAEKVLRSGAYLRRGDDYVVNYETGVLTFTAPLKPDELCRVIYRCDTPSVALNTASADAPVSLDIARLGGARVTFTTKLSDTGATRSAASTGDTTPAALALSGGWNLTRTASLDTALFLDPRGGNFLNRGGLRVAEKTRLGVGEVGVSYSRAGARFEHAKLSGIQAGAEAMEALGTFKVADGLTLDTRLRQSTQLLDTDVAPAEGGKQLATGLTVRELGGALNYAMPRSAGSLRLERTRAASENPDGKGDVRTQDTVTLTRALTTTTQLMTSFEAVATTPLTEEDAAANKGTLAQKFGLNISTRPVNGLDVTGGYVNQLGTGGVSDGTTFRVEATPFGPRSLLKGTKLRASTEDLYGADGTQRRREALVDLPVLPYGATKLSGGVRQSSTTSGGLTTGLLDARALPHPNVELSGSLRFRDGIKGDGSTDPDAADGYAAKVGMSPIRRLRLTGGIERNPEKTGGAIRRVTTQTVGLEAQAGLLTLSGTVGSEDEYLADRASGLMELGLTFRLTPTASLVTGFQGRSQLGDGFSMTRTYNLSFTHTLGSTFFSLNGSYSFGTMNGQWDAARNELRGGVNLGLKF